MAPRFEQGALSDSDAQGNQSATTTDVRAGCLLEDSKPNPTAETFLSAF